MVAGLRGVSQAPRGEIDGLNDPGPSLPAAGDAPSLAGGWRQERFGPRGADGKGRYWQWRRGAGKDRQSIYGGKING